MKYVVRADKSYHFQHLMKNVSLFCSVPVIQSLNCTNFYHANIFSCFVFSLIGQNWFWKAHGP